MRHVTAQLGTMRKPQEFSVMPGGDGGYIVQSDRSTGRFNAETRQGVLNIKGTSFYHLLEIGGAKPYEFPADFVAECVEACIRKGEEIGPGVIFGGTTVIR
jgi:hypothetical protein